MCKECYCTDKGEHECLKGHCPLGIYESELKARMQSVFLSKRVSIQKDVVKGFRKLVALQSIFEEDYDISSVVDILQDFFPAFNMDKIMDKEGYLNDHFYELLNMATDKLIEDETFFEAVMERPYSFDDD